MNKYRKRIYHNYYAFDNYNKDIFELKYPFYNNIAINYLPQDKNVFIMDLGCGSGDFILFLQKLGYKNIVGIDISSKQIESGRQNSITCITHSDIIDSLKNTEPNSKDIIITFDVLEHFSKSESVIIIDEVKRILKSKGKWLIHCPNGDSPFSSRIIYGDFTHETTYTKSSITLLLKSSGFTTVICRESGPIVHGLLSFIRFVLWNIIRIIFKILILIETGTCKNTTILTQCFLTIAQK